MNLLKSLRPFGPAVIAALAAGLFFALQSNLDKDATKKPLPPGIVTPGDQAPGPPSIIPDDGGTMKIEYRNIVFSRDNRDKALGQVQASGTGSSVFLSNPGNRLADKMEIM